MFEKLSLNEARHVLSDFFEIHTDVSQKSALVRAIQILDEIDSEAKDQISLGAIPAIRIGDNLVSFLPENCDPENIYLLSKEAERRGYTKKIAVGK